MSEVISLINLKGGVGKTVSSINIAYSFAEFNKKVPSLSLIVTNALTASNYVLIPVETQYLSFESLRVMLDTISMIQKKLNKDLQIKGIFLTKYQSRTKLSQGIREKVYEIYGKDIKVFEEYIPYSIKAVEQTLYGKSLVELAPDNPVSVAYMNITKELLADSEKCEFCDISQKKVWNPKQTQDVVSFVYDIGFVHLLKNKRPLDNLVRLLFCINDYSYTI